MPFISVPHSRTDGLPFEVNSVIRLIDINYIDPVDFRFSVTTAFKFTWTDNRVERPPDLGTGEMISLDLDFEKKLWIPDFYVYFSFASVYMLSSLSRFTICQSSGI